LNGVLLQVGKPNDPGGPNAQLSGREYATADHPVGCCAAYPQDICGFIKRCFLALGAFAFTIGGDAMGVPEPTDMTSCPGGAASGQLARTIEDGGNGQIRELPRQHTHEVEDVGLNRPTGLPDLVLPDRHFGVIAALPMDDQRQAIADDIDDDLLDEQPDDLLARLDRCAGTAPRFG